MKNCNCPLCRMVASTPTTATAVVIGFVARLQLRETLRRLADGTGIYSEDVVLRAASAAGIVGAA